MNREIWESAYLETRRNIGIRSKRIKLFELNKKDKILDCGCGDGLNLTAFQQMGFSNIYGIDISLELLRKANDFTVVQTDAIKAGLKCNSFDIVFVDSVFHHVNLNATIAEISRILRVGGKLCAMEPANSFMRKVLDLVTFFPFCDWPNVIVSRKIGRKEECATYLRWQKFVKSTDKLKNLLEKNNFRVLFLRKDLINLFCMAEKI